MQCEDASLSVLNLVVVNKKRRLIDTAMPQWLGSQELAEAAHFSILLKKVANRLSENP